MSKCLDDIFRKVFYPSIKGKRSFLVYKKDFEGKWKIKSLQH